MTRLVNNKKRISYIILLLFILLCASCTRYYMPRYKPNMGFSSSQKGEWEVLQPPNEWAGRFSQAMLPQYFPYEEIASQGIQVYNYFYALCNVDKGESLAFFINFPGSFLIRQSVSGRGASADIIYSSNEVGCRDGRRLQRAVVCVNRIDVEFDNSFVYFIVKGKKIPGQELQDKRRFWFDGTRIGPTIYNLKSEKTWLEKQPDKVRVAPVSYLSFYFVFDMTCTDFEDAIFVIDGLSRHGKKIPPLMVRMNYFDFSAVPEWQGEKAIQAQ